MARAAKKTETEVKKEKKTGTKPTANPAANPTANPTVGGYKLFLRPVVTEKTSLIGADRRRVVFKVDDSATKTQIRQAVEQIFGVKVEAVRTCNILGKVKRTVKSVGRRPGYKKAYITLKPGQTIDIVEGV